MRGGGAAAKEQRAGDWGQGNVAATVRRSAVLARWRCACQRLTGRDDARHQLRALCRSLINRTVSLPPLFSHPTRSSRRSLVCCPEQRRTARAASRASDGRPLSNPRSVCKKPHSFSPPPPPRPLAAPPHTAPRTPLRVLSARRAAHQFGRQPQPPVTHPTGLVVRRSSFVPLSFTLSIKCSDRTGQLRAWRFRPSQQRNLSRCARCRQPGLLRRVFCAGSRRRSVSGPSVTPRQ